MISYVCDRCNQPVSRADLRSGRVEHLMDSPMQFELCFNCFVLLRGFLFPRDVPGARLPDLAGAAQPTSGGAGSIPG